MGLPECFQDEHVGNEVDAVDNDLMMHTRQFQNRFCCAALAVLIFRVNFGRLHFLALLLARIQRLLWRKMVVGQS